MNKELEKTIKKKCKMKNKSSFVGFALAGLAAGAAAWYLFGTKEGRKNLNKAVDGFNEFSSTMKERANEGLDYASEYAEKAKKKAKKKFQEGKNKYEEGKSKFIDSADELIEKGKHWKDDAKDLSKKAADDAEKLADDAKNKFSN